MFGSFNTEVQQFGNGTERSRTLANSVEFILKEWRENVLPRGHKLSYFTHSVNSVTAAFGASWHHGWIQQLKDTARCLPRPRSSP